MARKATDKPRRGETAPRRRTSSKGGAKRPRGDIPGRVISAALDLAAGEGWRSVSMAALDWGLRQAEMLMRLCGFGAPPGAGEDTPAAG